MLGADACKATRGTSMALAVQDTEVRAGVDFVRQGTEVQYVRFPEAD